MKLINQLSFVLLWNVLLAKPNHDCFLQCHHLACSLSGKDSIDLDRSHIQLFLSLHCNLKLLSLCCTLKVLSRLAFLLR